MDSHLSNEIRKRHTLRTIIAGGAFFSICFVATKVFKSSLCPIQYFFGKKCLGCGMTRGFMCILKGDFEMAYKHNILSIPLFFCIMLYTIMALVDIFFNKNYVLSIENQLSKKYMFFLYAGLIALRLYDIYK